MAFKVSKLKHNRRFQHVVHEIEAAILTGDLCPGDQLPPELELKEMFGVGRGTLREALRVLEEKGLIVIRAGASGGAFVQEADATKLSQQLDLFVQARSISIDHVQQFREIIEPEAASLAAQHAAQHARSRSSTPSPLQKGLADDNPDGVIEGDTAVHVAIAELTGNPLLIAVLKMVHENIFSLSPDYTLEGEDTPKENLEDLRVIVDAVAKGDADEAEGSHLIMYVNSTPTCQRQKERKHEFQ